MSVSELDPEQRKQLNAEFKYCLESPCGEVRSYIAELGRNRELLWIVPKLKTRIRTSVEGYQQLSGTVKKVEIIQRELLDETFQSARDRLRTLQDEERYAEAAELRNQLLYVLVPPDNPLFGKYLELTDVPDLQIATDMREHLSESNTSLAVTFNVTVKREDTVFLADQGKQRARKITIKSTTYSPWYVERSRGIDTSILKQKIEDLQDKIRTCAREYEKSTSRLRQSELGDEIRLLRQQEIAETALLESIHPTITEETLTSCFSKKTQMNDDEIASLASIALHGETLNIWVSHDCNSMKVFVDDNFWFILGNNKVAAFFDWLGNGFKTRTIQEPRPAKERLQELIKA